MKLHLPKLLRNAVLACIAAVAGITTTLGTAAFTGGVVAFTLAQQRAVAADAVTLVTMAELVSAGTLGEGVSGYSTSRGSSYTFNGSGAILGITSSALVDALESNSGYVTIAAWVNPTTAGGEHSIFGYGAQNNGFKFATKNDKLQYTTKGRADHNSQVSYAANEWTLVAITLNVGDGTGSVLMAGEGSQTMDLGEWIVPADGDKKFAIGSGNQGSNRDLFSGEIRNLTAFSSASALTYADLVSVMGGTLPDIGLPEQVISGSVNEGINLDAYANDYQLIFALEGAGNKYFATNAVKVVNSDVQIGETDGDGTKGLIITNGNGGNHQIFTGKLTGNGLIKRTGNGSTLISFTGDTSEFNGDIELGPAQNNTFVLTFGSVTAGGNTYAATAGASSAESGIIGNGTIVLPTSRAALVFNYGRTDAPVYITNTFSIPTLAEGNVEMHGNLELRGGADYILTKALDVKGKLTIDAPITAQGGLTISGKLNLDSTDYLLPSGDGTFQTRDTNGQMVASADGNGFYTGDILVIEAGEGAAVALGANAAFQLKGNDNSNFSVKDGNLVYTGSIPGVYYAMNEQAQATNAIAGASGFVRYHVAKEGVLSVAVGNTLNDNNARNAITNSTGEGKISIQSGTSVLFSNESISSAFKGDIVINENAGLLLGSETNSDKDSVRVAELQGGIALNGGRLVFQGKTMNAARLTSTHDSSVFRIHDMTGDAAKAYIAEVDLQADLSVSTYWKSKLEIGVLTGAANLNAAQTNSGESQKSHLWIDGVEDFSGQISLGGDGGRIELHLNLESGQDISASQIEKNHQNASVAITGTGTLHVGNTFTAVDMSSLGFDLTGWQGYTGVKGAEITSATSTAAISKVGISDLTVKQGGVLTLEGDVWMGGTITLASTLVNNASKLTLAEDIVFDLSEMAYTGKDSDRVYQLFTQADLSALTMENLSADFLAALGMKKDGSVLFGADGSVNIITSQVSGMVWAQQDDLGNHGTWQVGQLFNDSAVYEAGGSYAVEFGELTNTELATPEKVQIVGDVTATRIDIAPGAGQVYQFYIGDGSDGGITAVEEGIHIASGTVIFGTSTLDMAQDTTISVGGGVLALESGAMSQQEYVDIELLDGSTLRWQAGNTDDYTRNGGLSVAQDATVTLDMGANAVELSEGIIGAVAGTTIQLHGTAGQDIAVASGVLGSAGVYLDGVDLALEAGAQYGFSLSNNVLNAHTEEVTIAASAAGEAKKTTLSGDNSAYQGEVEIGTNTTLELASAKALGENMALTGAGHVAFTAGGAEQNISYTLTTDDTYTGTTTVSKGTTLNWGEATDARSGAIKLDNGSTLVLNCGVDNAISDGLDSDGLAKGGVTITSLRDADNTINPVVWNSAGKTYTGLTTVSADTTVQMRAPGANASLSAGKVNLSAASSVLEISDTSWDGSWATGCNVYGAGTVLLKDGNTGDADYTYENVMLGGIVAAGEGNRLNNLQIASGVLLYQKGAANPDSDTKRDILNNISNITVESGATLSIGEDFSKASSVTTTLRLAGVGVSDGNGGTLGALYVGTQTNNWLSANIVLDDDTLIKTTKWLQFEKGNNNGILNGQGHNLTFESTAALDLAGNIANLGAFTLTNTARTTISGTVSDVTTMTINGGGETTISGKMKGVDTILLTDTKLNLGAAPMYNADGSSDGAADIIVSETSGKNAELAFNGINGSTTWKGDITLKNGTLFNILCYGYTHTFEGVLTFGEADSDVTELQTNIGHTVSLASMTGKGTLMLTRSNIWLGGSPNNSSLVLTGENVFAGTIVLDGTENPTGAAAGKDTELFSWKVEARHTDALKSATLQFNKTAAELSLQSAIVNAVGIKSAVDAGGVLTSKGNVTTSQAGNTLKITNTATGGVEFAGVIGDGVNIELAGGYQKLASANQAGTHVFTATGGTLDMGGYTRAADATGADTIIANGGTIKDLTLGAGMVLTQPALPQGTTTQDALVTSQLAGNLTMAGGEMKFYLGADKDGAVNTQYAFGANTGEHKLIITGETMLTFSPEASRGYIDSQDAEVYNYVLVSGITAWEGDLANLKHNFSEDGRAQHSFAVVDGNLVLHVVGKAATLAWTGETVTDGKKNWDVKTTDNWDGDNVFYSDDNVSFGALDEAQVVTVAADGVRIGSLEVTGGNYTFEGGDITSALGLGGVTISGGTVVFNNRIDTDGAASISGGNVTFNADNGWTGDTTITGSNTIVKVGDAAGLSDTKVSIKGSAELQLAIAGAANTLANSEVALLSGNIYATEDATVSKLTIGNQAAMSLNVADGKTLTATVSAAHASNNQTLNINHKSVTGTVVLNVGAAGSTEAQNLGNVNVERGALTANINAQTAINNFSIANSGAKVVVNGASGKTLELTKLTHQSLQSMDVTGGMTLKAGTVEGQGTLKLVGSTLEFSGANVDAKLETAGSATLKSTYAAGSTTINGKTLTLAETSTAGAFTTLLGNWTLNPDNVKWVENGTGVLKVGSNASTLTLTKGGSLKSVEVVSGSTLTANTADVAKVSMEKLNANGTVSNIEVTITGQADTYGAASWVSGGAVTGAVIVDVADTETIGNATALCLAKTTTDSVTINRGRVRLHSQTANLIVKRGIVLDGAEAVLEDAGSKNITVDADVQYGITMKQGSLQGFGSYVGSVQLDDDGVITNADGSTSVQEYIRSYNMGGITSSAQVNIGRLNVDAANGLYTKLTNVDSLTLAGTDNTITLIDTMTTGDSVLGITGTGAVALGTDAQLHIDISQVLSGLLDSTAPVAYKLGGDLSGLNASDSVVFDTALGIFDLKAEFGNDGLLTITKLNPEVETDYYIATDKQADSSAWQTDGKGIYHSAEGYSAIVIDKATVIDLTGAAPAEAQAGLGMTLTNLTGNKELTITGDGNDLVTITNTADNVTYGGKLTVTGTDVQILHTDANSTDAPALDTDSVYTVRGKLSITDGELLITAGKLQLNGVNNGILGGVTVADNAGQLILNGKTTLGGSIQRAEAADMLPDRADLAGVATYAAGVAPHIVLGQDQTTILADGATVEAGVIIAGNDGSTVSVADGGSATISQGAELGGAALAIKEGTTLNIDTTTTGGSLHFAGASIGGTLASTSAATPAAEAAIKVTQVAGGTSTYAGDLSGYYGLLELDGAGKHVLKTDAANTDVVVKGSSIALVPDDDQIDLRSLAVDSSSTVTLDVAKADMSNKKVNTTNGVTLDGTLNLTANLSTTAENGTVFTGGQVVVADDACINLTINEVSDALANALMDGGETKVVLAEQATGNTAVNITNGDKLLEKYIHNARVLVENGMLVLTGNVVDVESADFHKSVAETDNGKAGASLLDNAYTQHMTSINARKGDVKKALSYLEKLVVSGDNTKADETMAAVAGASTAVLGVASLGDIDRQLRTIRNRTTTMGVDQGVVNADMPYYNAWINAEGDHRELSDNGTEGGYKLNSWGGTVGFDVDLSPTLTAGMALTAMYGDLSATGADSASGDMDSYYVSAFARYCASAWTHTFVATVGTSDMTLNRTVDLGDSSYKTKGDTSAMNFGVMYEVGRVFALNEDATSCLQPILNVAWRHTTVDAYTEKGSDAGLDVGEQTMDSITVALGARVQSVVGENLYNRTSIFECRAMVKMEAGDHQGSSEVELLGSTAEVKSAEMGSVGVEAGAGITIPLGEAGESIFADASIEVYSGYTNVNGTVGYRINF